MFVSIFDSIFSSGDNIEALEFLLCIGVSLVLGLVLAFTYMFKNKYNPGTTADLTAASIFVSYLKSHFE